jgi:hypothetical protein
VNDGFLRAVFLGKVKGKLGVDLTFHEGHLVILESAVGDSFILACLWSKDVGSRVLPLISKMVKVLVRLVEAKTKPDSLSLAKIFVSHLKLYFGVSA